MAIVSLAEAKEHLRVTNAVEDDLIQTIIDASEEAVANYLNDDNFPEAGPIKLACLLFIGDMYENRSAKIENTLMRNPAFENLLFPYRKCIGI